MNRRLPAWVAAVFALLAAVGLLGLDRPLAEWVRRSGVERARVFEWGLAAHDFVSGMHVWYWLACCVALAIGIIGIAMHRSGWWPRAFVAAGIVQLLTLQTMILGKAHFGRLRPRQVFESGNWTHVWFVGADSFPSGHSAFYFGLCLPLAAACPIRWLRALLLAIPIFVVLARIDLAAHFLSDIATSAVIAALYTLIVAQLTQRWWQPQGMRVQLPRTTA